MIHIACASDDAYAPHAAALIHSLAETNAQHGVHIHYLHDHTLTAPVQQMLRSFCETLKVELSFIAVQGGDATRRLPASELIPELAWYRTLLPELMPAHDRVLYLDTDIIVRGSLLPFYETDLNDYQVACINDYLAAIAHPEVAQNVQIPYERYFNSGVMLLNLRALRAAGGGQRILDLAHQNLGRLHFPDQDALNLALGPQMRLVSARWNFPVLTRDYFQRHAQSPSLSLPSCDEVRSPDFDPVILHYSAHPKPWRSFIPYPYFADYHRHRAQTPWPRSAADTAKLRWRACWPLSLQLMAKRLKQKLTA